MVKTSKLLAFTNIDSTAFANKADDLEEKKAPVPAHSTAEPSADNSWASHIIDPKADLKNLSLEELVQTFGKLKQEERDTQLIDEEMVDQFERLDLCDNDIDHLLLERNKHQRLSNVEKIHIHRLLKNTKSSISEIAKTYSLSYSAVYNIWRNEPNTPDETSLEKENIA